MIGETHLARPLEPPRFAEAVAIFIAMPSPQNLCKRRKVVKKNFVERRILGKPAPRLDTGPQ